MPVRCRSRLTWRRRNPDRSSLPVGVAVCMIVAASVITGVATRALVAMPAMTAVASLPSLHWQQAAGRPGAGSRPPAARHRPAARPHTAAASFEPAWVSHHGMPGPEAWLRAPAVIVSPPRHDGD